MKLHVPFNHFKAALACVEKKTPPKRVPIKYMLFEFGETSYRIITSNRISMFITEHPYTKEDEIDDGDFSCATIEDINLKFKDKDVVVEFTDGNAFVNGYRYNSVQDGTDFLSENYKRAIPTGELHDGFPLILKSFADVMNTVAENLGGYSAFTFGNGKSFYIHFDENTVLIGMPASKRVVCTDPVKHDRVFDFMMKDIKEW